MGNRLRLYRSKVGTSQLKIAELSGISYKTYRSIEKYGARPRAETIGKLINGFNSAGLNLTFEDLDELI